MKYCLYHADADGCFSAFFIWLLHPEATFLKINYTDPEPQIPDGSEVWIVDFSWVGDKATMADRLTAFCARMKHVTIIDHHESASQCLAEVGARCFPHCKTEIIFKKTLTGTELSHRYYVFHQNRASALFRSLPVIASLIADYDAWRHMKKGFDKREKEMVEAVNAWFGLIEQPWGTDVFFNYLMFTMSTDKGFITALDEGRAALRVCQQSVARMVKDACTLIIGGHAVPCVNAPLFPNETATALLEQHPEAPFVATFYRKGTGCWKFSLRSRKDGTRVNDIAALYNGGGHPSAAGFTVKELADLAPKNLRESAQSADNNAAETLLP